MRLLFLRHGMTKGNQERRYIGVTDEPLSEAGREMLRQQMAERDEKELPGIVFVSPLIRCRETAQILSTMGKSWRGPSEQLTPRAETPRPLRVITMDSTQAPKKV